MFGGGVQELGWGVSKGRQSWVLMREAAPYCDKELRTRGIGIIHALN